MVLKIRGPFLEDFIGKNIPKNSLAEEILQSDDRVDTEFWQSGSDKCLNMPGSAAACEIWRDSSPTSCCTDMSCAFGYAQPCNNMTSNSNVLLASIAGAAYEASLYISQFADVNTARVEMLRLCETPFSIELVRKGRRRFGVSNPADNATRSSLFSSARGACLSASFLVLGDLYFYGGSNDDDNLFSFGSDDSSYYTPILDKKQDFMKPISVDCVMSLI